MKKIVILLGLSIASVLFGQDNNFSYMYEDSMSGFFIGSNMGMYF